MLHKGADENDAVDALDGSVELEGAHDFLEHVKQARH